MERRWTMTLAGAGTAVAAAGLSVLLVVLPGGARPAAPGSVSSITQPAAAPTGPFRG